MVFYCFDIKRFTRCLNNTLKQGELPLLIEKSRLRLKFMMDVWRRREKILLSLRSFNCFNNSNGSSTQLVPPIQCRIHTVYLGLVFCNRSCHFRNCFQKNCFYIEMVTRQILSAFAAVGELYKLPDSKSPHPTPPPFLKVGLCQKNSPHTCFAGA